MSTILSFISGGAVVASLLNIDPATLNIIAGVLAGVLMAVAALYFYCRATYRSQPKRRITRRPVRNRRIVTSVYGWQPAGAFA